MKKSLACRNGEEAAALRVISGNMWLKYIFQSVLGKIRGWNLARSSASRMMHAAFGHGQVPSPLAFLMFAPALSAPHAITRSVAGPASG